MDQTDHAAHSPPPLLLRIKRKHEDAPADEIYVQTGRAAAKRSRPDQALAQQMEASLQLERSTPQRACGMQQQQQVLKRKLKRFLRVQTLHLNALKGLSQAKVQQLVASWTPSQRAALPLTSPQSLTPSLPQASQSPQPLSSLPRIPPGCAIQCPVPTFSVTGTQQPLPLAHHPTPLLPLEATPHTTQQGASHCEAPPSHLHQQHSSSNCCYLQVHRKRKLPQGGPAAGEPGGAAKSARGAGAGVHDAADDGEGGDASAAAQGISSVGAACEYQQQQQQQQQQQEQQQQQHSRGAGAVAGQVVQQEPPSSRSRKKGRVAEDAQIDNAEDDDPLARAFPLYDVVRLPSGSAAAGGAGSTAGVAEHAAATAAVRRPKPPSRGARGAAVHAWQQQHQVQQHQLQQDGQQAQGQSAVGIMGAGLAGPVGGPAVVAAPVAAAAADRLCGQGSSQRVADADALAARLMPMVQEYLAEIGDPGKQQQQQQGEPAQVHAEEEEEARVDVQHDAAEGSPECQTFPCDDQGEFVYDVYLPIEEEVEEEEDDEEDGLEGGGHQLEEREEGEGEDAWVHMEVDPRGVRPARTQRGSRRGRVQAHSHVPIIQVQDWSSSDEECEEDYEMDLEGAWPAPALCKAGLQLPSHAPADGVDSEDSNAESYYANSYPDEESDGEAESEEDGNPKRPCTWSAGVPEDEEEYDLAAYHSSEEEREDRHMRNRKHGRAGGGVDWGGVGRRARAALRSQLEQLSSATKSCASKEPKI